MSPLSLADLRYKPPSPRDTRPAHLGPSPSVHRSAPHASRGLWLERDRKRVPQAGARLPREERERGTFLVSRHAGACTRPFRNFPSRWNGCAPAPHQFVVEISRCRAPLHRSTTHAVRPAADVELYSSTALYSALQHSTALQLYSALHSTSSTPSLRTCAGRTSSEAHRAGDPITAPATHGVTVSLGRLGHRSHRGKPAFPRRASGGRLSRRLSSFGRNETSNTTPATRWPVRNIIKEWAAAHPIFTLQEAVSRAGAARRLRNPSGAGCAGCRRPPEPPPEAALRAASGGGPSGAGCARSRSGIKFSFRRNRQVAKEKIQSVAGISKPFLEPFHPPAHPTHPTPWSVVS